MPRWASRPGSTPTPSCRSAIRWGALGRSAAGRSPRSSISTDGVSPIPEFSPPRIQRREEIMPRIAPVTGKSDVPAEYHGVVDDVLKVFGSIRGPFSILLHSPKLAERLLKLVTFNREENVVEPRLRSVAILSAVREREAAYVWAAQVGAARRAGLREEVIDLIRAKGDPAGLSDEERDIITYVRQLMRTNRVDQAVFDRLKNRHNAQWMVELTEVANYFAFLSGMVNPFEVPAPPDGDKLPG